MIPFKKEDPYPLLSQDSSAPFGAHSYAEAQAHSARVDQWLGLDVLEIEKKLMARAAGSVEKDQQLWIGLPARTLQTPYSEIRALLHHLNPVANETIVDLGAGYGRMGFVLSTHYPNSSFIGYEMVPERAQAASRAFQNLKTKTAVMIHADLSAHDFKPAEARYYFLYDFGSRQAIEKTLQDLRLISQRRAITVVGRGRASRDAIERLHPWLSSVIEPEHFPHYSFYRSSF